MDFGKLEWLFPFAITLHNAEEAIWMPSWDARREAESPAPRRAVPESIWAYLTFGSIVAMLANVFVPHLPAAIRFRGYAPGVISAVAINLPLMTFLALRAVRDGWVSGCKAVAFGAGVPLALAGGIAVWLER